MDAGDFTNQDIAAVTPYVARMETMDISLLGVTALVAFHTWVKRLGAEGLDSGSRIKAIYEECNGHRKR